MFLSKPEKQPCIFCKLNDTSACQQRLVIQCLLILLVKLVNLNLMGEKFKIPKIVPKIVKNKQIKTCSITVLLYLLIQKKSET